MTDGIIDRDSKLKGPQIRRLAGFEQSGASVDGAWQAQRLQLTDPKCRMVRTMFDERIAAAAHAFRLAEVDISTAPRARVDAFKRLSQQGEMMFLFHGTDKASQLSILRDGFVEDKIAGNTDDGYIGKGFYTTPDPEYSVSFIREAGVTRLQYHDPVPLVGTEVRLLGVLVLPGTPQHVSDLDYGVDIPDGFQSRYAWVNRAAWPTSKLAERFATEVVIYEKTRLYPRFVLNMVRVNKEIVWLDPNIDNDENTGYAQTFYAESKNAHVYCTKSEAFALKVLKHRKQGTERRVVTAGRGGKEFVTKLRSASCGCDCKVLVFCGNVAYHSSWAREFANIQVTDDTNRFKEFVRWRS